MSSSLAGVASVPPPQADPDLAKARRMLADWETCPSRKTSAGQAKIREYSAEVSELSARDNKAQLEKSSQAAAATGDATARVAAPSGSASASALTPGQRSMLAGTGLGARIDVYA
jgi:hypothetical protein